MKNGKKLEIIISTVNDYFIENNFRKNSKKGLYDIYPDCSPEIFINKMIGDL